MCIQRHPCKYKCFENYSALYQGFPQFQNNNSNFDCGCKQQQNFDCIEKQSQFVGFGNCNFFNLQPNHCPCRQKQNDRFKFCIQGTIKFDGSC